MRTLERDNQVNRAVEYLPDDEALKERRSRGRGLTRPELAVLLSYSKISLFDSLLQSEVADDGFFGRDLIVYFPDALVTASREPLMKPGLRRELLPTILANADLGRASCRERVCKHV